MSLVEELTELFGRGVDAALPEAEFDRLALAVFAFQFERNLPYGAFCRARGKTPETVAHWSEIPALPTAAFKEADLTTVPAEEIGVTYVTSGTALAGEKHGRHLLPDTRLYDASLAPNFQAHLLPDVERIRVLIFGPNAEFFPQSSLGHMNTRVAELFGAPGSGVFWRDSGPGFEALADALAEAEAADEPVCLLGTAFGFVHLLDWLAERERSFELPLGSRMMDTGGYKGRSREVAKGELYRLYGERFGIPLTHIVNEYGMTELGSQFYDSTLRDWVSRSDASHLLTNRRRKIPPPWVRVQVVDPESLAPLPDGSEGLLRFVDLANLHTVLAVQSDDLGVARDGGFEILGRASGAEPRGCSLAFESFAAAQEL
ncbi:MAG: long-chain fatty acid--CoA ligase [Actinomycetota bacterium]